MEEQMIEDTTGRRSFITGVGAAVAAGAVGAGIAEAQTAPPGRFMASRHADDDWLDKVPGKHRILVDAVTPRGAGEAVLYANNLYATNKNAYALDDKDLAIVIVMRHFATPFAYNDAFWAKYGKPVGGMIEFKDPKTQQSPTTNLYNSPEYGLALPNLGNTIDAVTKRGAHIVICDLATHFISQQLAGTSGNADAIYKELAASALIPGSRFVSAGVVAVTRAQERGYSLIYAG
ncbi:MAG: hypothetical protein DMG04_01445 [Acidobacteria bacterium]|nr:MAG: hypothetical protein DMG04_01445 [Acidobacteriota bacterium]PYQ79919.1 MAG: hypothetical protein DMG03_24600 [Acidobacteriota bacterium]PYQ86295.1 MAG: hypothetical protein DMG02_24740 [Acidobacteriota bacterium]PYR12477.1 MAG: hypothetical protein DMF99_04050 [Acidobacteriota bacterium]